MPGRSSVRAIGVVPTFAFNILSRQSNKIWLIQKNYITSLFMFLAWAYACSILFWKSTRHDDRKQTHNRKSEAPITRVNVCVYLRGMLHKIKKRSAKPSTIKPHHTKKITKMRKTHTIVKSASHRYQDDRA